MSSYTFIMRKKEFTRQEFVDSYMDEVGQQIRDEMDYRHGMHLSTIKQESRLKNLYQEAVSQYHNHKFWRDPLNNPVPGATTQTRKHGALPKFFN